MCSASQAVLQEQQVSRAGNPQCSAVQAVLKNEPVWVLAFLKCSAVQLGVPLCRRFCMKLS